MNNTSYTLLGFGDFISYKLVKKLPLKIITFIANYTVQLNMKIFISSLDVNETSNNYTKM